MSFELPENIDEIEKIEKHLHAKDDLDRISKELNVVYQEVRRLQQEYIEADFRYKVATKELYGEYRFEKGNLNT